MATVKYKILTAKIKKGPRGFPGPSGIAGGTFVHSELNNLSYALAGHTGFAPSASPTFTGTVVLPATTSIGTVSSAEISYVDGVTSAIQTQLNLKAPIASPTFTGVLTAPAILVSGLTASQLVATDASKNLVSLAVATYPSLTEISYVKNVTSAIQTQLNAKQPLHAALTSIAGLAEAAGTLIYGTADNAYAVLAAGATTQILVGGGAAAPVWTTATGTGAPVRGTAPTITNPVILNINPAANFTLTQNSVVPFTSVNAGAIVNTLYLKEGKVGIGTATPLYKLSVFGIGAANIWDNQIMVYDDRAQAAGIGGGITFSGKYTDEGVYTVGGFIKIEKQTADTNVYGFDLILGARTHGATPSETMRIKNNKVGIGFTAPLSALCINGGLHVGGTSDAGDNNLLMDGYVRSSVTPYVSQTTGWNISQEGAGDFRYLYADELHAKAFIADLEQALAGGQIICKSVAPLAVVFSIPVAGVAALAWTRATTTATVTHTAHGKTTNDLIYVAVTSDAAAITLGQKTITVVDVNTYTFVCLDAGAASGTITVNTISTLVVESFKGFDTFKVFVDNDIIRLRQFERTGTALNITNTWGTIVWISTDTNNKTQTYRFLRSVAPNAGAATAGQTIGIGVLALDYGTTGNGFLESNAIDGAMAVNSPYHQVVSWTTHPNSGLVVRTRLGNLNGIFSTANEFGLYAGDGIVDASKYLRISNTAVEIHNVPIKMFDGAVNTVLLNPTTPSFAMGATLPTAYMTGNGIWMGKDTAYKMRVGTVSAGDLVKGFSWDGTNLSIIGSITITGGSGYANISDKPTTLNAIEAGTGTKLAGIETGADVTSTHQAATIAGQAATATSSDFSAVTGATKPANNATVGAIWGTNLTDIPGTLGAPSGTGLFLSSTHMGYYTADAWKTFIKSDGTFAFAGDANNYVTWNGATLAIKGNITATTGTIGGFTIGATTLIAGADATRIELNTAAGIHLGATAFADALFSVTRAGALKAESGLIGGWTLAATTLSGGSVTLSNTGYISAGTGNDIAYISAADATYRFWTGHATAASAPFRVTKLGALTATGVVELGTATNNYGGANDWNVAIKGADIYENAFADHGGTIYINRIGYQGGTTKNRDTVIGNGVNTSLMANFQGLDNLINFSATTITLTGAIAIVGATTISTTLAVTGASTFTGLVKTVGGVHVGGTSDPGTDNLIVDGTVGIGGAPATSGLLDLISTTKTLVVPRMTEAQANAMTKVAGMIVYITDLGHFYGYTNAWRILDA